MLKIFLGWTIYLPNLRSQRTFSDNVVEIRFSVLKPGGSVREEVWHACNGSQCVQFVACACLDISHKIFPLNLFFLNLTLLTFHVIFHVATSWHVYGSFNVHTCKFVQPFCRTLRIYRFYVMRRNWLILYRFWFSMYSPLLMRVVIVINLVRWIVMLQVLMNESSHLNLRHQGQYSYRC